MILLVIGQSYLLIAQTPQWVWGTALGGRSNGEGYAAMVRDATGNLYVVADFEGTQSLGGPDTTAQGFSDCFISKYDANGTWIWSQHFGGTSTITKAGGIALDAAGNIYVAGSFTFQVNIGPQLLISTGQRDGFIAKLNPSGNILWGKKFGGSGSDEPLCMSSVGNEIYIAGYYSQAFSDGAISFPATSSNSEDGFIAKYDTSGTCTDLATFGGSLSDRAVSVSASATAIYLTGSFQGNVTFGSTPYASAQNSSDMFISKFDSGLNYIWTKKAGHNSTDLGNSVSQDANGNAYVAGYFLGSVNFGNSVVLVENGGYGDGFVVKYDVSGNCIWGRKISSPSNDQAFGISTDALGGSFVTGGFSNVASFTNTTAPHTSVVAYGASDGFVAKWTANGSLIWVMQAAGTNDDRGRAVLHDNNGFCNIAGNFAGTVALGTVDTVTAAFGVTELLLARINGFTVGNNELNSGFEFSFYPNPANDIINISAGDELITSVEIINLNGQLVKSVSFDNGNKNVVVSIDEIKTGTYILSVNTKTGSSNKTLVVQ